jgi:hypothetical protein
MENTVTLANHEFSNNRIAFRKELINLFLNEESGNGKGELASRYKYVVKTVGENTIYLRRPAQFNNGFDFTLNVSGKNFNPNGRATTRPTHGYIIEDLRLKKGVNEDLYNELRIQIDRIYNCQKPTRLTFDFRVGLHSEILLECIKWLFAEQDVTYWNYSGRAMFYNEITKV